MNKKICFFTFIAHFLPKVQTSKVKRQKTKDKILFRRFRDKLSVPEPSLVSQSSPNTPLTSRKLKSSKRHQSFSPVRLVFFQSCQVSFLLVLSGQFSYSPVRLVFLQSCQVSFLLVLSGQFSFSPVRLVFFQSCQVSFSFNQDV